MTHALFGTDGIRGTAGAFPLDAHTVRRVGAALVKALPHSGAKLLVGRDTRESGVWIERELAHGARTAGATMTMRISTVATRKATLRGRVTNTDGSPPDISMERRRFSSIIGPST